MVRMVETRESLEGSLDFLHVFSLGFNLASSLQVQYCRKLMFLLSYSVVLNY